MAGRQLPLLGQELHDEGGGGKREGGADHEGRYGRRAENRICGNADGEAGDEDLQGAEAEDILRERLQPLEGQLKADGEQEEDDAELGQCLDFLVFLYQTQARRSDDRAGDEIAENHAEFEPAQQRRHQDRRDQKDQRLAEFRFGFHGDVRQGKTENIHGNRHPAPPRRSHCDRVPCTIARLGRFSP